MDARWIAAGILVASLAGCAPGSDTVADRPVMPLPSGFAFLPLHDADAQPRLSHDAWWITLGDPTLTTLIEQGLGQNLDVRIALARMERASARAGATGRAALTTGAAEAGARATWTDGSDWGDELYASFEPRFIIDLFGRESSRSAFAQAELRAASFDSAAVRLAFQLDLAAAYFALRHAEAAAAVMRQSVSNRARLRDIVRERRDEGVASELDLRRAEAGLEDVRAALADLDLARSEAIIRIGTLLAIPTEDAARLLSRDPRGQPIPDGPPDVAFPAHLLENRPDILAGEQRFVAAAADLGVSRADLMPSVQFAGTLRVGATTRVDFGPFVQIPLLDRKARAARVAEAEATLKQAELEWRRIVRDAVAEVELGLVRYRQTALKRAATDRAFRAYRDSFATARALFDDGDIALSELLDLEQEFNEARLERAAATRDVGLAWAQLNVAVGHGWHGVYRVDRCCRNGDPFAVSERP